MRPKVHLVPPSTPFVTYVEGHSSVLTIGKPVPSRKEIHGLRIPDGSVTTEIIYAVKDVQAPIILGDKDENAFLTVGMFFALPANKLRNACYKHDRKTLVLSPYQ